MNKKITLLILITLLCIGLSSCSLAVEGEPEITTPDNNFFNQTELKGYVISFRTYDDGVNFDMGLDSENPFMLYEYENKTSEPSYIEMIQGNAIFMPLIKYYENDEMKSTEIESYIILGPKFRNTVMDVQQVIEDSESKELKINKQAYAGYMLSEINMGLTVTHQVEVKKNDIVEYLFKYHVEVRFVDELQSVEVLEYSSDNILLRNTVFEENGNFDQNSLEETDYVIIVEKYKKSNNDIYVKRTIYSRDEKYSNTHYFPLMFTNEIGYVENNKSIKLIFT